MCACAHRAAGVVGPASFHFLQAGASSSGGTVADLIWITVYDFDRGVAGTLKKTQLAHFNCDVETD